MSVGLDTNLNDLWEEEERTSKSRRENRPTSFYGKLSLQGRHVVLEKGVPGGKRDFDPALDDILDRRLSVQVHIEPITAGQKRPFEREFLLDTAEGDLFTQSVRALGFKPADLRDQYIRMDVITHTRLGTYQDRATGATRERTAGVVREVFPDAATCETAATARYGPTTQPNSTNSLNPVQAAPPPPPSPVSTGWTREQAAKFLPTIWERTGHDPAAFMDSVASMPMLAKHFTVDSPEIMDLILAETDATDTAAEPAS